MMREIDTRVDTYEPEIYFPYESSNEGPFVIMVYVEGGAGHWVDVRDYETAVETLKRRITYLENVCDEQTRMLTGD